MAELYALAADSVLPLTTPDIRPSRTKPIWEIVENASMRLTFVCAIAARFPMSREPTDNTISICCQSIASGNIPSTSRRIAIAKAANLGARRSSGLPQWVRPGTRQESTCGTNDTQFESQTGNDEYQTKHQHLVTNLTRRYRLKLR